MELNRCYVGDCRETLGAMIGAGVKVHTVVTSPPYWGLRDYGIKPSVWGGLPDCVHEWGEELRIHKGGPHGDGVMLEGGRSVVEAQAAVKDRRAGQFCVKCGAWLGALGLEPDYRDFIAHMVEVFELVRQVLRDDGTLWLNMGDSYASSGSGIPTTVPGGRVPSGWTTRAQPGRGRPTGGLKPKDLCMIPARVAIALQEAGWWVRSDIIWHKPNPMPESATDRPTKAHEYIYLLSKSQRYYYDEDAIKERAGLDTHPRRSTKAPDGWDTGAGSHGSIHRAGREKGKRKLAAAGSGTKNNGSFDEAMAVMPETRKKRSVWTVATEAFADAHFATFPRKLIEPCILAGAPFGGVVLDIFMGSGTTAEVAERLGRQWIGCELNPEYVAMQGGRRSGQQVMEV